MTLNPSREVADLSDWRRDDSGREAPHQPEDGGELRIALAALDRAADVFEQDALPRMRADMAVASSIILKRR